MPLDAVRGQRVFSPGPVPPALPKLLILLFLLSAAASAQSPYQRKTLSYGGRDRSYYLHLPPQYDNQRRLPLLILLHGGGGNATQALDNYPLRGVADREGFILVAPNGTGALKRESLLTWNVGFGFGYAQRNQVDDVGFVRALIERLEADLRVDTRRVYLTGLSNGAMLTHFAGAANADLLAGLAPVVGTVAGRDMQQPRLIYPVAPKRPLDIIMFCGELDRHVPYLGGVPPIKTAGGEHEFASALDSARFWVQANGCQSNPKVEELKAEKARRYTWTGGRNGTRVVLYLLHNQGHAWPGGTKPRGPADEPSPNLKAHEVLWEFFQSRPQP